MGRRRGKRAGESVEWIWEEDAEVWVDAGTNKTVVNLNDALVPPGPPFGGNDWGTFELDLGGIGEFAGSWRTALPEWGKAVGRATDGSGGLIKADLAPDLGEFPALVDFGFCGPVDFEPPVLELPPLHAKYVVIDSHG